MELELELEWLEGVSKKFWGGKKIGAKIGAKIAKNSPWRKLLRKVLKIAIRPFYSVLDFESTYFMFRSVSVISSKCWLIYQLVTLLGELCSPTPHQNNLSIPKNACLGFQTASPHTKQKTKIKK